MFRQNNPYVGQTSILDEIKQFFGKKDVLSRLMLINVLIFLVINIQGVILYLLNLDREFSAIHGVFRLTWYLTLPSDVESLLYRPWSIITYMFVQEDLLHLFFNMMVLYVGGRIYNQFIGDNKLLSTYFFSGILGGLLYILTFNIFPAFQEVVGGSFALGSSAAVLGIFVASATYVPNLNMNVMFIGNVKLKYIALIFIVLDILNIRNGNAGGHIAHLGGALFGYFFSVQYRKGTDLSKPFNILWDRLVNLFGFSKRKPRMRKVYSQTRRSVPDEDYLKNKNQFQAEIDTILEKIKKSGYQSLTTEEKHKLFEASKKY